MAVGLGKLGLDPGTATLLVMGIIVGGFINLPIRRIVHEDGVDVHPFAAFGLSGFFPQLRRVSRDTVIAVNVGGCIIPVVVAAYELAQLAAMGEHPLLPTIIATGLNIAVCYYVARPVAGIGITMPGLLSPLVAAGLALILAPQEAPPVAFVAGVLGPLIGADLLHLKDFGSRVAGIVSIGGAGTFDGIVLSGILAAYLA
ncbi:MAG: DUF1614 domain-containing protein [Alphaproteobacteria bacterium]|nr:DUF1614 domain-containing protein [Alphaproteobacteria bacterium]